MITRRNWWRRLRLGLPTVLGLGRYGFFLPYRLARHVSSDTGASHLEPTFAAHVPVFDQMLGVMSSYLDRFSSFASLPPPAPRFDQDWFPRLDAMAAYAIIRARVPARVLEIGGGHSTRFLAQAVQDGGHATSITVIEPRPRPALRLLAETGRVRLIEAMAQDLPPDAMPRLAPGDVLSLDGSHILMPGTDVDAVFNRLLPGMPAGVLMHVHDVFLPDPYPAEWEWRGYNEQLAIAPLLAFGLVKPLFSSHFVATRRRNAFAASGLASIPLPPGARESSFWAELVRRVA